jgi:hypothetical protein
VSDDIVTRLRRSTWRDCIEAADEIERLRRNTGCARHQGSTQFCAELVSQTDELKKVIAERDEARRMVCSAYAPRGRDIATERGWDCWKEDNHGG